MENSGINQPIYSYLIIDAARTLDKIERAKELQKVFRNLYNGQTEAMLGSVAPYLFSYEPGSDFSKWILENSIGESWGIYIKSKSTLDELAQHLRKLTVAKTEEGNDFYFRFYDPRVLRVFLPSCDEQQLSEFFGPVDYFEMEDVDSKFVLRFSMRNNRLYKERFPNSEN